MRAAFHAGRAATVVVVALSVAAAVGHLSGMSALYRPIPGGPATHPVTLVLAILLAVGLRMVSPIRRLGGAARVIFLVAAGVAVAQMAVLTIVASAGGETDASVLEAVAGPDHGNTGVNTLVTGLLIACGQLLRDRFPHAALVTTAAAPVLPLLAAFGYAFGLVSLYGEMSPVSVALLLPLSFVGGLSFVRRATLRPLFADTFFGRSSRVEILAGLGFPLVIGALVAHRYPDGAVFIAMQAALMAVFAAAVVIIKSRAHAATELQRQRTVRALRRAAVTDHLTGLCNRHGAMLRIDALADRRSVGVILADLDNFKRINDMWGHASGDRVLSDVARVLRDRLKPVDVAARWGGEEFLIVLPGCDLEATIAVAEELRAAIAAVPGPRGNRGEVTASFGVSQRFAAESSLEGAIYRADLALYNAKDTGRDKVARDACAACDGMAKAAFQRALILSDKGPMGCGCTAASPASRRGSVSTASDPAPGSLS